MIRSVSQVALALTVIILLLPMLALAQPSDHQKLRDAAIKSWRGASAPAEPASAASAPAYTKADITRDTPCGAPGVGEVWGGERAAQKDAPPPAAPAPPPVPQQPIVVVAPPAPAAPPTAAHAKARFDYAADGTLRGVALQRDDGTELKVDVQGARGQQPKKEES